MALTDPTTILALATLVSAIIAGFISYLVMRNAAKKDSLTLANDQIAAQARTIETLSSDISKLRNDYGDLWKQSRKDKDEWSEEREKLKSDICNLKDANKKLQEKISSMESKA